MDYLAPAGEKQEVSQLSALGLAHMGDAVWELLVRTWFMTHGAGKVNKLHQQTVSLVRAPAQAKMMDGLKPLLTPEEDAVYHRGRNTHLRGIPKAATTVEYAKATGLEALFGYLWLTGQRERINLLFAAAMEEAHGI